MPKPNKPQGEHSKFPPPRNRLEEILRMLTPHTKFYLRRGQTPNLEIIGKQVGSQFKQYIKNHPKLSNLEKTELLCSFSAKRLASISPILRGLTNRRIYEIRITEAVLALASGNKKESEEIQKKIEKMIGVEEDIAGSWISQTLKIFFEASKEISSQP